MSIKLAKWCAENNSLSFVHLFRDAIDDKFDFMDKNATCYHTKVVQVDTEDIPNSLAIPFP